VPVILVSSKNLTGEAYDLGVATGFALSVSAAKRALPSVGDTVDLDRVNVPLLGKAAGLPAWLKTAPTNSRTLLKWRFDVKLPNARSAVTSSLQSQRLATAAIKVV
jgi:hypothetical protein